MSYTAIVEGDSATPAFLNAIFTELDIETGGPHTFGGGVFIANSQGLVIGHTAQVTAGGIAHELQVLGTGAQDSSILLGRWSANASGSSVRLYKSRNASIGSSTAVTTGDSLGNIIAYGDDGTDDDTESSAIIFDTEGTVSTGQVPGVIKLQTAAAGSLTTRLNISSAGLVGIGETVNSKMVLGLTINQSANDDEILAFKSSDVAHGITDDAETDTFGAFTKSQATSGGLLVIGYKDADGAAGHALQLAGRLGEAADTTKSASGLGVVEIHAAIKSGTARAAVGADGNLAVITNNGSTQFIFDVEGTAHANDVWTDSVF